MYGTLLSQPDIVNLSLHRDPTEFTYTQICYRNGSITLRGQSDTNRTASDVAARLKVRGPIVHLETYVQDTKIELPPSQYRSIDGDHSQLSLTQSTAQHRESILLRPGDTIDFRILNVKIEIALSHHLASPRGSSVTMVASSDESAVKHDDLAQNSETDSDNENLMSPRLLFKNQAASKDKAPSVSGDSSHEPETSFHTQPTQPLDIPSAAVEVADPVLTSHDTTTSSSKGPADTVANANQDEDESIEHEVGEAHDDNGKDDLPVASVVSPHVPRGLKRKSEARADQYDFPGDADGSDPEMRRKRAKLPKAARQSEEDGGEVSSARPTISEKLNRPAEPMLASRVGVVDFEEPASSPSKPPPKSSKLNTLAHNEEESGEEETADEQDEIAAATPPVQSGKKRGRPSKASRDSDAGSTTKSVIKKPRKSLRSAVATATPAKKVSRKQTATPSATVHKGRPPKILLSASDLPPAAKAWMTKNKIERVDETPSKGTNFVCVVRDKVLPSTLKVLQSLVAGKAVVCDSWINDSRKKGELLDTEDYIHADLKDVDADSTTRRSLFAQKTLFFTVRAAQAYKDWQEVVKLANEAGAVEVLAGNASKGHATKPKESVIFFGENNAADDDAEDLIKTHGRVLYDKTALAKWIINADIDLENDEHVLTLPLGGTLAKKGAGKKAKK
ncbi:hypothetical protein CBER1_01058 [Cercospora berteroae]|uniref:BRCT domain-containing protein n=1 Tax=Cercospora berteroae TaxID=357750 RepID=A0A2S6C319_9PEZI|nr:hypothetical protein CBER1_01058 [Cercospora berteroae]